jgi:LysM repeat protein
VITGIVSVLISFSKCLISSTFGILAYSLTNFSNQVIPSSAAGFFFKFFHKLDFIFARQTSKSFFELVNSDFYRRHFAYLPFAYLDNTISPAESQEDGWLENMRGQGKNRDCFGLRPRNDGGLYKEGDKHLFSEKAAGSSPVKASLLTDFSSVDVDKIYSLEKNIPKSWRWKQKQLKEIIESENNIVLFLTQEDSYRGYLVFSLNLSMLLRISVDNRGELLGSILLEELLEVLKEKGVKDFTIMPVNGSAVFYEKFANRRKQSLSYRTEGLGIMRFISSSPVGEEKAAGSSPVRIRLFNSRGQNDGQRLFRPDSDLSSFNKKAVVDTLVSKNSHNLPQKGLGRVIHELGSKFYGVDNILFSNPGVLFGDILYKISAGDEVQNVTYGDTGPFDARFAKSYFRVYYNPFHIIKNTISLERSQEGGWLENLRGQGKNRDCFGLRPRNDGNSGDTILKSTDSSSSSSSIGGGKAAVLFFLIGWAGFLALSGNAGAGENPDEAKNYIAVDSWKTKKPANSGVDSVEKLINAIRPSCNVYRVRKGDNLYLLARKFHTTKTLLRALNNLDSTDLKIGQNIYIPHYTAKLRVNTVSNEMKIVIIDSHRKKKLTGLVYKVATGKPLTPTPLGDFVITGRLYKPDWWWQGKRYQPYESDYPYGIGYVFQTDRGFDIHSVRHSLAAIGNHSHGCVRMDDKLAEMMWYLLPAGTKGKVVQKGDSGLFPEKENSSSSVSLAHSSWLMALRGNADETCFPESRNGFFTGNTGQFGHALTSISFTSTFMSDLGIGRPSSRRDSRYNSIASFMLDRASSTLSPWEAQPGSEGTNTEYPPSGSSSITTLKCFNIMSSLICLNPTILYKESQDYPAEHFISGSSPAKISNNSLEVKDSVGKENELNRGIRNEDEARFDTFTALRTVLSEAEGMGDTEEFVAAHPDIFFNGLFGGSKSYGFRGVRESYIEFFEEILSSDKIKSDSQAGRETDSNFDLDVANFGRNHMQIDGYNTSIAYSHMHFFASFVGDAGSDSIFDRKDRKRCTAVYITFSSNPTIFPLVSYLDWNNGAVNNIGESYPLHFRIDKRSSFRGIGIPIGEILYLSFNSFSTFAILDSLTGKTLWLTISTYSPPYLDISFLKFFSSHFWSSNLFIPITSVNSNILKQLDNTIFPAKSQEDGWLENMMENRDRHLFSGKEKSSSPVNSEGISFSPVNSMGSYLFGK